MTPVMELYQQWAPRWQRMELMADQLSAEEASAETDALSRLVTEASCAPVTDPVDVACKALMIMGGGVFDVDGDFRPRLVADCIAAIRLRKGTKTSVEPATPKQEGTEAIAKDKLFELENPICQAVRACELVLDRLFDHFSKVQPTYMLSSHEAELTVFAGSAAVDYVKAAKEAWTKATDEVRR